MKRAFYLLTFAAISLGVVACGDNDTGDDINIPQTTGQSVEDDSAANYVTPSPGEMFAELEETTPDVDWKNYIVQTEKSGYDDDRVIALNLGNRLNNIFLSVLAKDRDAFAKLSDVAQDLALQIHVSEPLIARKDHMKDLVRRDKWDEVRRVMDEMYVDIMREVKRKENIGVLTEVGAWMSGLKSVSQALTENYNSFGTKIFYQPEVVDYYITEVNNLEEYSKDNPIVKQIIEDLVKIKEIMPKDADERISREDVRKLYEISSNVVEQILAG